LNPPLISPLRRRRLNHAIRAGPAGKFGTMRDDHAELRRDDVEPLRRLLADHMHRRAAAGAVGIFWRNRHVDVRQMGRKCAAIGASLISALACARKVLLVLGRLVATMPRCLVLRMVPCCLPQPKMHSVIARRDCDMPDPGCRVVRSSMALLRVLPVLVRALFCVTCGVTLMARRLAT
jgi:hypothetical protein